jgi:hypothetical protein
VRTYLLTSPRWALGLFGGLAFAVLSAVFVRATGSTSWPAAVLRSLLTGAFFGVIVSFTLNRQRRQLRAAAGDLPADQLTTAYRAAARGPVPADPQIRAAAVRIAQSRLATVRRVRVLMSLAAAFMLATAVVNALAGNLWLSILSVTSVVVWGSELYQLRRLPRRVEALSCPAEPDER